MKLVTFFVVGMILVIIGSIVFFNFESNSEQDELINQENVERNAPTYMQNGEWKKIIFGTEKERDEVILSG